MASKVGEFLERGGHAVGWLRGRAPANGRRIAICVYQDAAGDWYTESGDGEVSWCTAQPAGVLYASPAEARGEG